VNQVVEIIDYAVRMRKFDRNRQMDVLLKANSVTETDIQRLAKKIAGFHKNARVIYAKDLEAFPNEFDDLGNEKEYVSTYLSSDTVIIINHAIEASNEFIRNTNVF